MALSAAPAVDPGRHVQLIAVVAERGDLAAKLGLLVLCNEAGLRRPDVRNAP